MAEPVRVAMWSGPRNLSTALMRSWGSRPDTAVVDEPLYAVYLSATGLDHPGRDAVLASQPTDWREVAAALSGPVPGGAPVWVQKQMAHHLLPHVGRAWLDAPSFRHAFLIRDPAAVVVSLDRVTPGPALDDTGLPQQVELFERMADRDGVAPPVIDTADLLRDPRGVLSALCAALGLPFDPAMLAWAPGPRATDGVWAEHWYGSVWASTTFGPPRDEAPDVPDRLRPLVEACRPLYDRLAAERLRTGDRGPKTGG
ncbi:HAD family hydrolase [Rubrivirga sp.]|uniref:sulfotransferase-like domain-containing protein n=1 Tax=Rubrivirga sp. TaxID=1885344 RepID=UPI003B516516